MWPFAKCLSPAARALVEKMADEAAMARNKEFAETWSEFVHYDAKGCYVNRSMTRKRVRLEELTIAALAKAMQKANAMQCFLEDFRIAHTWEKFWRAQHKESLTKLMSAMSSKKKRGKRA